MKKNLKKILAGLSAFALLSTTPAAFAYNLNEPKLVVQSEKRDLHVNFSKDGSKFAYARLHGDMYSTTSEIVVSENGIEKIITQGYLDMHPAFSPDGKKIAFFRSRGMGYGTICVVDSDGKNLQGVLFNRLTELSWSPDGKELSYTDEYIEEKTRILTEEDIEEMKKLYQTDKIGLKPGDEVKYKDYYQAIALVNIETKETKYLTTNEGNCGEPDFMDDGRVVYILNKERDTNFGKEIWMVDIDGKNKKPIVQPENSIKSVKNDDGSETLYIKRGLIDEVSVDGYLIAYLLYTTDRILRVTPSKDGYEDFKELKEDCSSGIYVKNLKNGEIKLVTDEGSLWFPEIKNNKVYFSRFDDLETEHNIYSIDLE